MMSQKHAGHSRWANIDHLVRHGGDIAIGSNASERCTAAASDEHSALAILVRRSGETLDELLTRLDEAIQRACEEGEVTDELNE
jgi:hypothetical protein